MPEQSHDEKTPEELTAAMLRQTLYVIKSTPARSPEIKKLLPKHLDYQIKMERDGSLFGAGPLFEEGEDVPFGGMIVVRAGSFDEAKALADADPFHAAGLRSYTITRWMLNEGSMTFTVRYSDQTAVIAS